ncbi:MULTISPECIES: hemerythrin domain-containing protein [Chromobacterium]|uniref:Hemerythrin domain-containing protein n=2 Tax=Chromobacterium TaxID=535 RepID=A0ABS3GSS1_9NEIS|nr:MULTISPECIES: hemerythrin domain-containing protein [Chromobacterium]AXT47540.1 hemerythrin domain-containing protein [Chromobacterium rhizoryzae]MBK0416971.1 hemerythrin domain-containing protein [Chromobacterium haemolyticum]MBO0418098.1 hemerythrin domain-containing protein [Chromobacterium haemolyticum]MBO0501406.1 hemerythrin domain-containing protein [Chromobacterium haemolyticum]PTU71318.1 hemerythrin HHE cation-binding protein [Chromobacterium haemolyticum]
MKRHPALQELSREHHHALKMARQARLAAESGDPERQAQLAAALRAWSADALERHFAEEETALLPRLAQTEHAALAARALDEHRRLRELIAELATPQAAALARFAQLMEAHVRFEERELFERFQACLPAADGAALSP